MKATINKSGSLIITPENELEAYALEQWVSDNVFGDKPEPSIAVKNFETSEE